jgi:hypothetical protein
VQIGTLNEGALHAQLKEWYRRPGDPLVEIQTGGFAPLRRKLELLTQEHPVRLVAPVPVARRIVRLSDDGEVLSARRSPPRGRIEDIFSRLVSIPSLLCLPRFELEIVLTHQDELRVHRPGKAFRRRGWVVTGRRLVSVEERRLLATPPDAAGLLPHAVRALRHRPARAGGGDRAPARPADDLLLAGNGRARHRRQAERRRRPSARGVAGPGFLGRQRLLPVRAPRVWGCQNLGGVAGNSNLLAPVRRDDDEASGERVSPKIQSPCCRPGRGTC